MATKGMAAMLAILLMVAPGPLLAGNGNAATPPGREATPTARGEWEITGDTVIGYDYTLEGNVTVLSRATLRIEKASTFTAMGPGAERFRFRVMVGAAVEIANGSRLMVDAYESEPGTGLSITGGSRLSARSSLNATIGHPTVLDSSITVTSGEGEDARLGLNCSSWGDFQRSNLTITAGDGAAGEPGKAGQGGGRADLFLGNAQLYSCNITAHAGSGGDGGPPRDDPFSQGTGGAGGSVSARLDISYISGCRIAIGAGWGGNGPGGKSGSPGGPGSGGTGGRGGDAALAWSGANLLLSDTQVDIGAGAGGHGGDGADAPTGSFNGGNGADGGAGGTASVSVSGAGTFTFLDSRLSTDGGAGGAAGRFGPASGEGTDGASGAGGGGGGALCTIEVQDMITGTNSSLSGQGGSGGTGGTGPLAGAGGPGGGSSLSVAVVTGSTFATALLDDFLLSSGGGPGGSGGRPFPTGNTAGIPGRGGLGGASALHVDAEGSIRAEGSSLRCEPGSGGSSSDPNQHGTAGQQSQVLSTERGDLSNGSVSQTIGPVDGEDRWTLVNTRIAATEHFNVSGKGAAEEYWTKRVTVKDVGGSAIMDGSATVEVRRNGTLLESRRSNSRGESEFQLLDALYTASGVQYRSYVLSAHDTRGRASQQITVFWTPDLFIDLVLVSKQKAPLCTFARPAPGNATTINVTEYAGPNGTRLPFFITGESRDNPLNDEPRIENVQLRFGETGRWMDLDFRLLGDRAVWNFTWDIYPWAEGNLAAYPLGIIPLAIYARSFNGYNWSDDLSRGGSVTVVNPTVRLLRLPGPPPDIETASPARSTAVKTAGVEVLSGKQVTFNARVALTNGLQVLRWAWCFDDTGGFREDFRSNLSPAASHVYPADQEGQDFFAILKVYDNESARRVELLRAGVAYDEFGYDFDPQDGSTSVRIRVLVKAPPGERPGQAPPYWALAVVAAGVGIGILLLRVRKKK